MLVFSPLIGQPAVVRTGPILLFVVLVTLLAARPWIWTPEEWSAVAAWTPPDRVVRWAALVASLMLFWIVLTRFRSGDINAVDFTVYYDRPVFQTTLGHTLFVESADDPLRAYRSYFAVHAHWVNVPLAALHLIAATPLWLLALSVVAVVAGAILTLRIVQHAGGGGLIAVASALAFLLNDNTARTLIYGFHTEVLYAWFIPWMILAGLRRRWWSFLLAGIACVAVKEDAFLPILGVVVAVILLAGSRLTPKECFLIMPAPLLLALVNLVAFYKFVVPGLSATGAPFYANYWDNFGPTAMTAAIGMARHPWQVLTLTVTSSLLTKVLVPHLYLPFAGWRWVAGILPIVVLYGSSVNEQLRSFGIYYAIVLVPFLVLGAAHGAQRVATLLFADRNRAQVVASIAIVVGALLGGISDAGYSLRPWRSEITATPQALEAFGATQTVLVQSSLYPHVGYAPRFQLLTPDTLKDPRYDGAVLLLAPAMGTYPLTFAEVEALAQLPAVASMPKGLVAVRRPQN